MKKILAVAVAIAVLSLGLSASAQIPYVQVSFDDYGTQYADTCPPVASAAQLSVWACNFNMWFSAIEYMIDYTTLMLFMGDVVYNGALKIGSSPTGIGISYPVPGDGRFGPFLTQRVSVWWACTDCTGHMDSPIVVLPHPVSGQLRAVRWPDLTVVHGVGMVSLICPTPPVPTEGTTWGALKSLYK